MRTKRYLERIEILLNKLDAAVVVRDPGNARSAEVFEGLRRTIIQSGKSHRSHVAHLLSLQESLERGATLDLIRNRVKDFLNELGVEKVISLEMRDAFEIVGGTGDGVELVEPAVVERLSDGSLSVIQLGKARRFEIVKPSQETPQETVPTSLTDVQVEAVNGTETPTAPEQQGAQS